MTGLAWPKKVVVLAAGQRQKRFHHVLGEHGALGHEQQIGGRLEPEQAAVDRVSDDLRLDHEGVVQTCDDAA